MAFRTAAVSVGTTATKLTTFADDYRGDFDALVYNNGASTVFVGGPDVTTANGIPVPAGQSLSIRVEAADPYGIVASGTVECRVGSMGVS